MTRPFRPNSGQAYAEVIGDPIAQSKSPLIHNFWLEKLGIDAEYRAYHVRAEELADYFAQRRGDAAWRGCNVTMPHKQDVMPLLDKLATDTQQIGAVNCVVAGRDGLTGSNTDFAGFAEPLPDNPPQDAFAIVVGAGGAARAVTAALWSRGYKLAIANRNRDKARALADAVAGPRSPEIATPSLAQLRDIYLGPPRQQPADLALLVNASALGMTGSEPLDLNLDQLKSSVIVYDLVYSPLETTLLANARRNGLPTIDGLAMLIGQAAAAFEKFFGESAPRQHDAELRALLTA